MNNVSQEKDPFILHMKITLNNILFVKDPLIIYLVGKQFILLLKIMPLKVKKLSPSLFEIAFYFIIQFNLLLES